MSLSDLTTTVNLTHDDAEKDLFDLCADETHYRIKSMVVSVYKAAQGEGGILEFLDGVGNSAWTIGVDSTFCLPIDFGERGLYVGKNTSVHAVVSGADNQASVWLQVTGYLSVD